jgi:predicted nucleotidyltransferase
MAGAERAFAGEPVIAAYLFGSVARGDARPDSDVDIAVLLEPTVAADQRFQTGRRVARRLTEQTGFGAIDVVVLDDVPLALRGRVLREAVLLHGAKRPERVSYESRTLREFTDFEVHARPLNRALLAAIAAGRR